VDPASAARGRDVFVVIERGSIADVLSSALLSMTTDDYHIVMRRVNIAELKARLSEHLRYVRRGHSLTILDRDTPVATIVPVAEGALLTIRQPIAGTPRLRDIALPEPLKLEVDPVALLIGDREGGR
jgi:prevent-host-death family protein